MDKLLLPFVIVYIYIGTAITSEGVEMKDGRRRQFKMKTYQQNIMFTKEYYIKSLFFVTWGFFKNEKNVQPKVVTNNQYFSPFQSKKSKSKILSFFY